MDVFELGLKYKMCFLLWVLDNFGKHGARLSLSNFNAGVNTWGPWKGADSHSGLGPEILHFYPMLVAGS